MVWYGMVNVDLYSAIITKVSNALNTLVSGEKPGFPTLSKGLIVLPCAEVVPSVVSHNGPLGCTIYGALPHSALKTTARPVAPQIRPSG